MTYDRRQRTKALRFALFLKSKGKYLNAAQHLLRNGFSVPAVHSLVWR